METPNQPYNFTLRRGRDNGRMRELTRSRTPSPPLFYRLSRNKLFETNSSSEPRCQATGPGPQGVMRAEGYSTNLTGLLVRDTRSDSRQLSSFSSVMPERSSWTYSWDESVHSCLLFLSPPWKTQQQQDTQLDHSRIKRPQIMKKPQYRNRLSRFQCLS